MQDVQMLNTGVFGGVANLISTAYSVTIGIILSLIITAIIIFKTKELLH